MSNENIPVAVEEKTVEMSNSKKKRMERKAKNNKIKMNNLIGNIISYVIVALIAAFIIFVCYVFIKKELNKVSPSSDYSINLSDNGFYNGVKASEKVTLPDYKNIVVPKDVVAYSDEDMQEAINEQLDQYQELDTTGSNEVEDGMKINLDYVGTIDGEAFEGGTAEGYDLTIGSGSFIEGFEDQLIGHTVNEENVVVNVTFPDDYSSEELQGKDAVFTCKINGIYKRPAFDDNFVKEHLSEDAQTADEYRAFLTKNHETIEKNNYVGNYLKENTTVNQYPASLVKGAKEVKKYDDLQSYEQMNQIYAQYYGQGFSSFEEYTGQTEDEYNAELDEAGKEEVKNKLMIQAIAEEEGIDVSEDEFKDYIKEQYGDSDEDTINEQVEKYGKGYLMQEILTKKVNDFVNDLATIEQ